jgi:tRNA threonylcarbamoyladenosine biosynthesis protein TsaB
MSIALCRLQDGENRVWQHTAPGAALASANLLPAILELMQQAGLGFADLDAVVFGRGPGAFTGLRTACAVAQGLGFGAQALPGGRSLPLLPVDTLMCMAEVARHTLHAGAGCRIVSLLDARMDEFYLGAYEFDGALWQQHGSLQLQSAARLVPPAGWDLQQVLLAGNVFDLPGAHALFGPVSQRLPVLPQASALLRLAPALLAAGRAVPPEMAWPIYIRDKVAQTTEERAAAKAAAAN